MKYTEIWEQIKKHQRAEVTASLDNAATVVQGVKRTKCVDNVLRRKCGLPYFPKMYWKREDLGRGFVKLTFWMDYDFRV